MPSIANSRQSIKSGQVHPNDEIAAFGQSMRERLSTGKAPFRKSYPGTIIYRVEVDDRQIQIGGR